MLISAYNPAILGDVLVVVLGADTPTQSTVTKANIVQISNDHQEVIGYNFFGLGAQLGLTNTDRGQVLLSKAQIAFLNQQLSQAGFEPQLMVQQESHFVVGEVLSCDPHPHSDHLHVCQIQVDEAQPLQIVCGAPNIAAGQKVVVAKVGTMMPSGKIIFPSKLRHVESLGMVCSARELALPNAQQRPDILVLPASFSVGAPIDLNNLAQSLKA